MSLFDLLFLALAAAAAATFATAGWFALRGEFVRAGLMLRGLLICAGAYMVVVVAMSAALPRRVLGTAETQCFDDWCIAVAGVRHVRGGATAAWQVDLHLSSRARRIQQRENNLAVYLTDDRGMRYDPVPDPSAEPLDTLLGAGESVRAARNFILPAGARNVGLVVTHEGGFPIGWFIIGYPTWFRKPPVVKLD